MTRPGWITAIETDWGSFRAPDDMPPMERVLRNHPWVDEDDGRLYEAMEPLPAFKDEFYSYVKDQGERLRDGVEPQTYTDWQDRG